tara:strand:+ start:2914 stop:3321 length:408 start_codon:yes stop_codon:yes gene_type:complete
MKLSKKTKIWSAVGVTVLAIGLILAFKKPKENKYEIKGSKTPKLSSQKNKFPLETGSGMGSKAHQNSDVQKLQEALNKEANRLVEANDLLSDSLKKIDPLKIDGKFGKLTAELLDILFYTKRVNEELFNKIIKKS